jgi:hypothetical protein
MMIEQRSRYMSWDSAQVLQQLDVLLAPVL